jgi:inorganic triphosphatase YgiF
MQEVELKFNVAEPSAGKVLKFVREAGSIASHRLGPVEEKNYRDIYFDTAARDLSKIDASLRIRIQNKDTMLVTLKTQEKNASAPSSQAPYDIHTRQEIEGPPNDETVRRIYEMLRGLEIIMAPYDTMLLTTVGVKGLFSNWGFAELFHLDNNRLTRRFFSQDEQPVGEMAFDRVQFSGDNQHGVFCELEIESLRTDASGLKEVADVLLRQLPSALSPSRISKYQRGLELAGVEEHHKIETKLIVREDEDKVASYLKSVSLIADFELGLGVEHEISDHYYDTNNLNLSKNSCYVRLRTDGPHRIITLRKYQLAENNQMIDTLQIKQPIHDDSIHRVLEYLIEHRLVPRPKGSRERRDRKPDEMLESVGLRLQLSVKTKRTVFPLSDKGRRFASIKFDEVVFSSKNDSQRHHEIEISTSSRDDAVRLQAVAYVLMSKFALMPTSLPKYEVGLSLIRGSAHKADYGQQVRIWERHEERVKAFIEARAKNAARRELLIYGFLLITAAAILGGLTYMYTWAAVEPWTYFVSLGVAIAGYMYFVITTKTFSPEEIYHRLIEKYKNRYYKEVGL